MGGHVVQGGAKCGTENGEFQTLVCPSRKELTALYRV
jgi:hypothetical protein